MRLKTVITTLSILSLTAAQYAPTKGKGKLDAMPVVGLGTFGIGGWMVGKQNSPDLLNATRDEVKMALTKGLRLVDTAMVYGNEKGVGMGVNAAIKDGKIKREDIWITTKLWSSR
jgi:alcohol dehydrogenase (NADP+)